MPKLVSTRHRSAPATSAEHTREIWFHGRFLGQEAEEVEFLPLRGLTPHPERRKLRTPRGFITGIARALRLFPHPQPIVVDEQNRIVRGLSVYRAAKLAGLRVIAVRRATRREVQGMEKIGRPRP